MNKTAATLFILFIACGMLFAAQPSLKKATIQPTVASPGDSVAISVEFSGAAKDIQKVILTVHEYPEDGPRIQLAPVAESKANTWAAKGRVPWDAPSETVHLDISAIDKDGKEIVSKGFEDNSTGKTGTIELTIK